MVFQDISFCGSLVKHTYNINLLLALNEPFISFFLFSFPPKTGRNIFLFLPYESKMDSLPNLFSRIFLINMPQGAKNTQVVISLDQFPSKLAFCFYNTIFYAPASKQFESQFNGNETLLAVNIWFMGVIIRMLF